MYSRTYDGRRFSPLADINRANVKDLQFQWVFPILRAEKMEATPLVVDGVMYLTQPVNHVVALKAATGEKLWEFDWPEQDVSTDSLCCGRINRGLAIHGDTLFMGTIDARLVAIDAMSGQKKWDVQVGDPDLGMTISAAPLIVKNAVVTGVVASQNFDRSDSGPTPDTRGFISAYDATTGSLKWRLHSVPDAGESGNESWGGDSWRNGGGSTWLTGSYDPDLDLLYWGVGNPSPVFDGRYRAGDNLYTSSVLAMDPDTGRLKWHFQFTPHDVHDWDAAQVFVLADIPFNGASRKVLLTANRNGFFYALDRQSGEFLFARAFAEQTWSKGFDSKGRPLLAPNIEPTTAGTLVAPNADGATSWWSPAFNADAGLFYVVAHDGNEKFYQHYNAKMARWKSPVASFIRALDVRDGALRWQVSLPKRSTAGILATAGGLIFSGNADGEAFALEASTGQPLWRERIGGWVHAGPISFRSGGAQLVTVVGSGGVYTFGLPTKDRRPARWGWLQLAGDSRATYVTLPGGGSGVRVVIERSVTDVAWHVQWNVERFSVAGGRPYAVRFRAKADAPRVINVAFARAAGDRSGLGLYQKVALSDQWQEYEVPFTANADEPRARILFDLGGVSTSVELSDIDLVAK